MASERHRLVGVGVEKLLEQSGHWCNRCNLGSGWMLVVAVHTRLQMHLQTRLWCDECELGDRVVVDWLPTQRR